MFIQNLYYSLKSYYYFASPDFITQTSSIKNSTTHFITSNTAHLLVGSDTSEDSDCKCKIIVEGDDSSNGKDCANEFCSVYCFYSILLFSAILIYFSICLYLILRSGTFSLAKFVVSLWPGLGSLFSIIRYSLVLGGVSEKNVIHTFYLLPLIFFLNSNVSILYYWNKALIFGEDIFSSKRERMFTKKPLIITYIFFCFLSSGVYMLDVVYELDYSLWNIYLGVFLLFILSFYFLMKRRLMKLVEEFGELHTSKLKQVLKMINILVLVILPFGIILILSVPFQLLVGSSDVIHITRQLIFRTLEGCYYCIAIYIALPEQRKSSFLVRSRTSSENNSVVSTPEQISNRKTVTYTFWSEEDEDTRTNPITFTVTTSAPCNNGTTSHTTLRSITALQENDVQIGSHRELESSV